MERCFNRSDHN